MADRYAKDARTTDVLPASSRQSWTATGSRSARLPGRPASFYRGMSGLSGTVSSRARAPPRYVVPWPSPTSQPRSYIMKGPFALPCLMLAFLAVACGKDSMPTQPTQPDPMPPAGKAVATASDSARFFSILRFKYGVLRYRHWFRRRTKGPRVQPSPDLQQFPGRAWPDPSAPEGSRGSAGVFGRAGDGPGRRRHLLPVRVRGSRSFGDSNPCGSPVKDHAGRQQLCIPAGRRHNPGQVHLGLRGNRHLTDLAVGNLRKRWNR